MYTYVLVNLNIHIHVLQYFSYNSNFKILRHIKSGLKKSTLIFSYFGKNCFITDSYALRIVLKKSLENYKGLEAAFPIFFEIFCQREKITTYGVDKFNFTANVKS